MVVPRLSARWAGALGLTALAALVLARGRTAAAAPAGSSARPCQAAPQSRAAEPSGPGLEAVLVPVPGLAEGLGEIQRRGEDLRLRSLASRVEPAGADGCRAAAEADDCSYYRCREALRVRVSGGGCGADGYYLGYGLKYCERFRDARGRFSDKGRAWVDATRSCLIRHLERNVAAGADCGFVRDAAFAAHPACYVGDGDGDGAPEGGHDRAASICGLPARDWLVIMLTIDPKDGELEQGIVTQAKCLRSWLEGLDLAALREGWPAEEGPPLPPRDAALSRLQDWKAALRVQGEGK